MMPRPHILIVEDDQAISGLLEEALDLAGYMTFTASNGLFALEYMTLFPIQTILRDINMPVMDGVAFVAELERRQLRQCPIIVLTASRSPGTAERIASIHAEATLLKPFHLAELLNTLRQVVYAQATAIQHVPPT